MSETQVQEDDLVRQNLSRLLVVPVPHQGGVTLLTEPGPPTDPEEDVQTRRRTVTPLRGAVWRRVTEDPDTAPQGGRDPRDPPPVPVALRRAPALLPGPHTPCLRSCGGVFRQRRRCRQKTNIGVSRCGTLTPWDRQSHRTDDLIKLLNKRPTSDPSEILTLTSTGKRTRTRTHTERSCRTRRRGDEGGRGDLGSQQTRHDLRQSDRTRRDLSQRSGALGIEEQTSSVCTREHTPCLYPSDRVKE